DCDSDDAIKAGTGAYVHATDTASITAHTDAVSVSLAAGFSEGGFTGGIAVGVSLADNLVSNQVHAVIDRSNVDADVVIDGKAEASNTFSSDVVAVAVSVAIQISEVPLSIAGAGAGIRANNKVQSINAADSTRPRAETVAAITGGEVEAAGDIT